MRVGYRPDSSKRSKPGFMESDLFKSIGSSRDKIECRGLANEVCVCDVCLCFICMTEATVVWNTCPGVSTLYYCVK